MKFVLLFTFLSLSKCDLHLSTFDDEDSLSTNRQVRSLNENEDQNEGSGMAKTGVTRNSGSQGPLIRVLHYVRRENKKITNKMHALSNYKEKIEDKFNKLKGNHKNLTLKYHELKRVLKTESKTFKKRVENKFLEMNKHKEDIDDRFNELEINLNKLKNFTYTFTREEPSVNFDVTRVENLEKQNKKLKKDLNDLSIYTESLQERFNELKTIQENLTPDHQSLKSSHQSLKADYVAFKNLIFDLMGARDCSDVKKFNPSAEDGVFTIKPFEGGSKSLEVFCEFDSDNTGWIVLQKRIDSSTSFKRNWSDYLTGFGDKTKNYWLGLSNMYSILKNKDYVLRIELEKYDGQTAYAEYNEFYLDDESEKFALHVGQYTGTAGNALERHNEMKFLTQDQINSENIRSRYRCAFSSGGWWLLPDVCPYDTLNGEHQEQDTCRTLKVLKGIRWPLFNKYCSLRKAVMKVKRKF